MTFLLLSIVCATAIVLIFKAFTHFRIPTFQAIVVNYWVCVLTGSLVMGRVPVEGQFWEESWFPFALILGCLFISGFYVVGRTVQALGLAIASVMQKMSLLISVPFAIVFFQESSSSFKIAGIVLALFAVVLTNLPSRGTEVEQIGKVVKKPWQIAIGLPALTFIISGIIECILQYVQGSLLQGERPLRFSIFLFGTAACIGTIVLIIRTAMGQLNWSHRAWLGGAVLGVVNLGSIVFLLEAFDWQEKSLVLPINNVSVIGLSTLLAVIFFRERLAWYNLVGVVLAMLSIGLITS